MQSKECIDTELLLDTLLATSFSPSVSQTLSSSYPIGITELLLDTLLATSFSPSVPQTLFSSYLRNARITSGYITSYIFQSMCVSDFVFELSDRNYRITSGYITSYIFQSKCVSDFVFELSDRNANILHLSRKPNSKIVFFFYFN